MSTLMLILILLAAFIVPALIFGLVLIGIVIYLYLHVEKIMFELPWFKWLTLDDVVKLGQSKFAARMLLPAFHDSGHVEVRQLPNLDEDKELVIKLHGFSPFTVQYHEFRIVQRPRRKRRIKISLKDLFPSLRPVNA